MNKAPSEYFDKYNAEKCEVCGDCLVKCPVLKMNRKAAIRAMTDIRNGNGNERVLRRCESCFGCNIICPNGANPAQLFIEAFHESHLKNGFPAWSFYFQPHEENNFRNYIISRLPSAEKALLEKWKDMTPCDEFVYPGCNVCATPYLTRAGFMEGLNIRGSVDLCCGEMYYRTGMHDKLREIAEKLNEFLDNLGAKRMMILCSAGYNMFSNVLPQFGLKTDVEFSSYINWLWDRIESGEIEFKRKLDITATIQESCYGKTFGEDYYEIPRMILSAAGTKIIEMPHSKERAYCCGIGGGFPPGSGYNPIDITAASLRVVNEAVGTGAKAIVAYCSGCMQSMSAAMAVYPVKRPVYHLLQVVQYCVGENPEWELNPQRGATLVRGILLNQAVHLLNPKRIKGS
jgi:Fe-S oxidoreductase